LTIILLLILNVSKIVDTRFFDTFKIQNSSFKIN